MEKILCIEDQAELREDLAEELVSAGYEVYEAGDGREGLEAIRRHQPDLVLCDVNMPVMNGRELLKQVRENHQDFSNMPFIFLTALGTRLDVIEGKNLGADDYLTKPVDFDLLLATVRSRLQQISRIEESNQEELRKRDSEIMMAQATIRRYAYFDALTGLPNRTQLSAYLKNALVTAEAKNLSAVLVFIELEHFGSIGVRLGRPVADKVLKTIGDCLADDLDRFGELFATDEHMPFVATLGPATFAVLLPGVSDTTDISRYIERTTALLAKPIAVGGTEVFVCANIGISRYPEHGTNEIELLHAAGVALQIANAEGNGVTRTYDPILNEEIRYRADLMQALHNAVKDREFELHYQPQVDIGSGRIVGVEALMRWRRPGHGLVYPASFISVAEATGLIVSMTECALATACRQVLAWRETGWRDLRVAVNLSPKHLKQPDFVDTITRIVDGTGLPFTQLELEITESAVVDEGGTELEALRRLHDAGISLSIDDFGTGYSSLSYLKRFPFDTLKIDQSFVRGIGTDPRDQATVEAIIQLARSHDLGLIAEGVETEDQLEWLRQHGCDLFQGFLFSEPLPSEDLRRFVDGRSDAAIHTHNDRETIVPRDSHEPLRA